MKHEHTFILDTHVWLWLAFGTHPEKSKQTPWLFWSKQAALHLYGFR